MVAEKFLFSAAAVGPASPAAPLKRDRRPASRAAGTAGPTVFFRMFALGFVVFTMLAGATVVLAEDKTDSCVACHAALPEQLGAPVEGMKQDIHGENGLSCADCHGGDSTDMDMAASMAPERGFRGKPKRADI